MKTEYASHYKSTHGAPNVSSRYAQPEYRYTPTTRAAIAERQSNPRPQQQRSVSAAKRNTSPGLQRPSAGAAQQRAQKVQRYNYVHRHADPLLPAGARAIPGGGNTGMTFSKFRHPSPGHLVPPSSSRTYGASSSQQQQQQQRRQYDPADYSGLSIPVQRDRNLSKYLRETMPAAELGRGSFDDASYGLHKHVDPALFYAPTAASVTRRTTPPRRRVPSPRKTRWSNEQEEQQHFISMYDPSDARATKQRERRDVARDLPHERHIAPLPQEIEQERAQMRQPQRRTTTRADQRDFSRTHNHDDGQEEEEEEGEEEAYREEIEQVSHLPRHAYQSQHSPHLQREVPQEQEEASASSTSSSTQRQQQHRQHGSAGVPTPNVTQIQHAPNSAQVSTIADESSMVNAMMMRDDKDGLLADDVALHGHRYQDRSAAVEAAAAAAERSRLLSSSLEKSVPLRGAERSNGAAAQSARPRGGVSPPNISPPSALVQSAPFHHQQQRGRYVYPQEYAEARPPKPKKKRSKSAATSLGQRRLPANSGAAAFSNSNTTALMGGAVSRELGRGLRSGTVAPVTVIHEMRERIRQLQTEQRRIRQNQVRSASAAARAHLSTRDHQQKESVRHHKLAEIEMLEKRLQLEEFNLMRLRNEVLSTGKGSTYLAVDPHGPDMFGTGVAPTSRTASQMRSKSAPRSRSAGPPQQRSTLSTASPSAAGRTSASRQKRKAKATATTRVAAQQLQHSIGNHLGIDDTGHSRAKATTTTSDFNRYLEQQQIAQEVERYSTSPHRNSSRISGLASASASNKKKQRLLSVAAPPSRGAAAATATSQQHTNNSHHHHHPSASRIAEQRRLQDSYMESSLRMLQQMEQMIEKNSSSGGPSPFY